MKDVTRYHPLLVLLHWVLAFLIGGALLFGAVVLAPMSSVNPAKMEGLRTHMGAGLAILTLMGVRLAVRRRTSHPPAASAGSPVLDRLARLSHQALYIAIFAQAISGLIMALQARLLQIVFGAGGRLPTTLWVYPLRYVHFGVSRLLMALIALHLAGALYHTFVRRDRLLHRMALGRRTRTTAAPQAAPTVEVRS